MAGGTGPLRNKVVEKLQKEVKELKEKLVELERRLDEALKKPD